jgi:hypothetical protein
MNPRYFLVLFLFQAMIGSSQGNFPWQNALVMVRSTDGINFHSPSIFQDSSGVPCIIHWKGDTLVAVFQWFRQPNPSPSWDRVAVKFSYNNGSTWTQPLPIVVNGLPSNYQRPFDPTIVITPEKTIRIFFSSSIGTPPIGLDASVNTYSAISSNGIDYDFEPNARFDHPTGKVIDPAATIFNGVWQYTAPIGAPQDGAYHCTSTDGINFIQGADLPSDNAHNWTGNMLVDGGLLLFYGSGPIIWRNSSTDGNSWSGYTNTNIMGGDPGIVKLADGTYLMVYVGPPNIVTATFDPTATFPIRIFPNPFQTILHFRGKIGKQYLYHLYQPDGKLIKTGQFTSNEQLEMEHLSSGVYLVVVEVDKKLFCTKLVKQ